LATAWDLRGIITQGDPTLTVCEVRPARSWRWGRQNEDPGTDEAAFWRAGLLWYEYAGLRGIGFSLLYPVLLTTLPAAFLWYKDRRRFGTHACGGCGYDRRGLPAQAKCPECGTVPARG
jgi:hypothetical protein